MTDSLRLSRLVIHDDDRQLVRRIDLVVSAGETVALVGASGSGKTLTGLALVGMLPDRLRVDARLTLLIAGQEFQPYSHKGTRERERNFRRLRGDVMGWLPQDARGALDPRWTVARALRETMGLSALGRSSSPEDWLLAAGIQDPTRILFRHPHELSGGTSQRVCIALSLARGSRFLVADEPTTGLDPRAQQVVLTALRRLNDRGVGVLFITHDLDLVARVAQRAVVVSGGETVDELRLPLAAPPPSPAGRRLWDGIDRLRHPYWDRVE